MKTYRVVVQRSGAWWAAHTPDVPGVHTQARSLEQIETEACEAIALMLDIDPESIAVRIGR